MRSLTREGPGRLYFESQEDHDNAAVFFVNKSDGLTVSVAEVHPVDSYNDTFECTMFLSPEQARQLRDYLNMELPK